MCLLNQVGYFYYFLLLLAEMMERLSKIKDFDLDKLKDMMAKNPHLQERLNGAAVRSQMEEARRMDIEQMRELQK